MAGEATRRSRAEPLEAAPRAEIYSLMRRAHTVAKLVEAEPGEDTTILKDAVAAISDALEKAIAIMETEQR